VFVTFPPKSNICGDSMLEHLAMPHFKGRLLP
jgi:hypothetical protein